MIPHLLVLFLCDLCLEFQLCFHRGVLLSDVTLAVKLDLTNKLSF